MVVAAVLLEGQSIRVVAARFNVSKFWVHKMVSRYRDGGAEALTPTSRAPRTNPRQMSLEVEERIVALRKELDDLGADSGAHTISVHLGARFGTTPSVSAIYRALKRRGFITDEPRKRPKASYVRFEASLPNECWRSVMGLRR